MTKLDKQFIMFKFFLSMEGIYINDEMSNKIHRAFDNALSDNINYNNSDAYYDILYNTIKQSEQLFKEQNTFN